MIRALNRVLSLVISACFALGGGGIGVVGVSYGTHSPRLMIAGALAAAFGTGVGAILLDRALQRATDAGGDKHLH
jgi:hypothetical protein